MNKIAKSYAWVFSWGFFIATLISAVVGLGMFNTFEGFPYLIVGVVPLAFCYWIKNIEGKIGGGNDK
jgi:uncharacterized membrane protein YccC